MSTLEVLETLDWTNSTIRDKYQDIILRENAHMARICNTAEGLALVSRQVIIPLCNVKKNYLPALRS